MGHFRFVPGCSARECRAVTGLLAAVDGYGCRRLFRLAAACFLAAVDGACLGQCSNGARSVAARLARAAVNFTATCQRLGRDDRHRLSAALWRLALCLPGVAVTRRT